MNGCQGQYDKGRVHIYVPKVEEPLLVSSLLAELTVLSCKGNAMISVYFKDPGEKRNPRGSVLEKTQCELARSATRVTDNSKQLLKWSGLKGLCMGKLSSLDYFYV